MEMESRSNTILALSIFNPIIPGLLIIWRLYSNLVTKKFFRLADCLIFIAFACNVTAMTYSGLSANYGLGKHIYDPTWTPELLVKAMRSIYIAEVANLLSMFFTKLSIATFLLYLDFAKRYRYVMWSTVAVVFVCNGIFPMISILGTCRPIALNWDMSIQGTCWPRKINTITGYVQSGTNILTDLIYSAAPIIYLSTVQLPPRVQWGLRVVFLFGILATVCSVVKVTKFSTMEKTTDPTWDSFNLTVWASAEVNTAILAACLPPLRSQFDQVFIRITGQTFKTSRSRTTARTVSAAFNSRTKSGVVQENDYGSELDILPRPSDADHGITKTIDVRVVDVERLADTSHYAHDFESRGDARRVR